MAITQVFGKAMTQQLSPRNAVANPRITPTTYDCFAYCMTPAMVRPKHPPITNLIGPRTWNNCRQRFQKIIGLEADLMSPILPRTLEGQLDLTNTYCTCALTGDGVQCWGDNEYGQTTVPHLNNPISIEIGSIHTCALTRDGVRCWGNNEYGQTDVPYLRNPKSISAGESHTCVLTDDGVHCWGDNEYGQTDVPDLENPVVISGSVATSSITDLNYD